jgi:hypothetical protein
MQDSAFYVKPVMSKHRSFTDIMLLYRGVPQQPVDYPIVYKLPVRALLIIIILIT